MTTRARFLCLALGFGAFGAVIALLGSQTGSIDVMASPWVSGAWGSVVGAATGCLVASLSYRSLIPIGIATVLAACGFIAGTAVAVHVLGHDLLDGNTNVLMSTALTGAGAGWIIGAAVGAAVSADAPPLTAARAWTLRGAAVAAATTGISLAWMRAATPGLWGLEQRFVERSLAAILADAALVALTLLLVAGGRHPAAPETADVHGSRFDGSRFAKIVAAGGVALGCVVFIAILAPLHHAFRSVEDARRTSANWRTVDSLSEAARRYQDRVGVYPPDLETLLAAGGELQPGSVVSLVRPSGGRLCLMVGTDVGTGAPAEPFVYGVVRPQSMQSGIFTSSRTLCGSGQAHEARSWPTPSPRMPRS